MSLRSKTANERSSSNFDQLLWQAARRMAGLAANRSYSMSLRSKPPTSMTLEKTFRASISRLGAQVGLAAKSLLLNATDAFA